MRHLTTLMIAPALAALLVTAGHAQTGAATPAPAEPAATERSEAPTDKYNQKAEHIRVEDAGSRVDEVRVGGQTQSITVQPKVGNMPAYEVKPTDGARNRPDGFGESQTKKRVWNVGNW